MNDIIIPELISDEAYDAGYRILSRSVKKFFELPGVKEDYERWLQNQENREEKKK